ncbi:hypothetical protein FN846DRAFT_955578 [Sphaerosporella brunnea]|uniref:Uncharacterized protein n=1 Tax=Sphaerosporella brunnea TaxID=1250544 RepID=A0A5J5ETB3_9PEZI|nr:hypothetical protein FN846DRAFT_955578 [Sphaerosporella brunnea]
MAASPTSRSAHATFHNKVIFNVIPHTASKMSVTETFYLAHKARGKLSSEASRSDHNLRLLVGHANLLDTLMIHLAEAEAEQERWYQDTVRGHERESEEEYGSLAADYDSESESDEDEDYEEEEEEEEEEDYEEGIRPRYMLNSGPMIAVQEIEEDEYEDDYEDEEDGMFALTRTTSHRPPSLCSDESDDDEEEAHPPSPTQPAEPFPVSRKDLHDVSYFHAPHSSLIDEPSEVILEDGLLPAMVSSY